jgi:putative membrane protein
MDVSTHLAYERTQVAHERTMMAWVRTATSLITFGFTIYKFFEFEAAQSRTKSLAIEPRVFGLVMVVAGLVALVLASIDYARRMRLLRAQCPDLTRSTAMLVVAAIAILGVFALIAIVI